MDELFEDFSCHSYLFIVKKLDNKDLTNLLTELEKRIKEKFAKK